MALIEQIVTILLAFFLYSLGHSLLAATRLKERLARNHRTLASWYRVLYNLSQTLLFGVMMALLPKPRQMVWHLHGWPAAIFHAVQVCALVGLLFTLRSFDVWEFLGLRQVVDYYRNKGEITRVEQLTFSQRGMFRLVRHPLYSCTLLLFLFRPRMDLFGLLFWGWLLVYFVIGARLEERRLIGRFGEEYRQYRRRVGAFFPKFF